MKLKVLIVILTLCIVPVTIIIYNLPAKVEIVEIINSESIESADFVKSFNLNIDKINIKDAKKEWCLCGVDLNGYYFTSNEIDGQIKFYYYDKISDSIKMKSFDTGNCIYNTYFYRNKIYVISKETDGQSHGGAVSIVKVDMHSDTIETIYKDNGEKYPEYYFYENNLVIANSYREDDSGETYKITMINLDDYTTTLMKDFTNDDTFSENFGKLVRIAGTSDFLYTESEKNLKEDGSREYVLTVYDLKTEHSISINLDHALDYIAGDGNLFVSRIYATVAPLTKNAIAFNEYNSQTHVYEQHEIFDTDSTNHPYELGKIKDYYVLLLTRDIIVVDMKNLTCDTINYRSRVSSENISPPFIIDNKIYYMKEVLEDENFNRELYIYEIN